MHTPFSDLLRSPLAAQPSTVDELLALHAKHAAAPVFSIELPRSGRPAPRYESGPGGVAVLQIAGIMLPKPSLLQALISASASSQVESEVGRALRDPSVKGLVLDVDSPGGAVLGIPSLVVALRALAATKPVVAVCTGAMASAAYWAGSAANAVYVSGLTDVLGSLGVVAVHRHVPPAGGAVHTEVVAGRFKTIASEKWPLTAEGAAHLRAQVDEVYRVMVNDLAGNRGVTVADALAHMADGRIFIGQQAIDAGLADGVASVEAIVEQMATDPTRFAKRRRASIVGKLAGRPAPASAPARKAAQHQMPAHVVATAPSTPAHAAASVALPPAAASAITREQANAMLYVAQKQATTKAASIRALIAGAEARGRSMTVFQAARALDSHVGGPRKSAP